MRLRDLLTASVAVLLPAVASAQDTPAGVRPYRFTVEGYAAQARFAGAVVPGDTKSLGGYGARVLLNHSTPAGVLRSFFGRATVGAFLTHTAKQGDRAVSTTHFGGQADFALFSAPIFRGALDPFVSVAAGGMRVSYQPVGGGDRAGRTDVAVTPALGTRIPLFSGIGARGDLRLPVTLGMRTGVSPVAEGGAYLSF